MNTTESLQTLQVQVSEGSRSQGYVLRFQSLFDEGRAYAFPCDDKGLVDLDALSEKARNNYLYARAVIGLECQARVAEFRVIGAADIAGTNVG